MRSGVASTILPLGVALAILAMAEALVAPAATAQWSLGPPDLAIEEGIGAVAGVLVRDNLVYVADYGFGQVIAFDGATGRRVASTGRESDGPRRRLAWIGDCGGDRVLTSDALRRVDVYSPELTPLRTISLTLPDDPLPILSAIQCAGSDGFAAIHHHSRDPRTPVDRRLDPYRSTFEVVLFARDGTFRHAIGPFPGQDRIHQRISGGQINDRSLLWGRSPVLGSSERGFVLGDNDAWSLVRYDPQGSPLDILTWDESRSVVTDSHREAHFRRMTRSGPLGPANPSWRYWSAYPYPSHLPAYFKVVASADGFVWVERFDVARHQDPGRERQLALHPMVHPRPRRTCPNALTCCGSARLMLPASCGTPVAALPWKSVPF